MARTPGAGRQLPLMLPVREALDREDFLVTASNAEAVSAVDQWPQWDRPVLFLVGPAGSGKSHLGAIWRAKARAASMSASSLSADNVTEALTGGALLIEDAPGASPDERALFHLLNLAREQKASVLLTTRQLPALWPASLPDLRSRLRAAAIAVIGPPDDALLRGVLVKHFSDRQIAADEAIVSFLMSRMERSLETARLLVAEIDRRALEERAEVTRAFAARVLSDWPMREPPTGEER